MICIFFTLFFTLISGLFLVFFIFGLPLIPLVFSFFYNHIPIAELATIETFIEIGLLLYLILTKIFDENTFVKVLAIIITIFLAGIAIYISVSYSGMIWLNNVPVLGNLYEAVFDFFSGILDKLSHFFTGK